MSPTETEVPAFVETSGAGGERAWHVPSVSHEQATRWMQARSSWFGSDRTPVPSPAPPGPACADLALVDSPIGPLVAKRERTAGAKRIAIRCGLRRPRTRRAFHLGHDLLAAGLPTPEPVAWLGGSPEASASVLLTRFVEADDPWSFLHASPSAREPLFEILARRLAELHDRGFRHRDLKAPNILIRRDAGGSLALFWIDLDGLRAIDPVRTPQRRRDLARLCASFSSPAASRAHVEPRDWTRFLERYAQHAGLSGPVTRGWEQSTRRWAQRHIEANRSCGRPLS